LAKYALLKTEKSTVLHSTHGLYLGAGVMQPGMVTVEVPLAGVVRLVGMFVQLEHEG